MSCKNQLEPPCRRFLGNDHSYINFNMIQAHQKLRENGCDRLKSIKFLTTINCKTDASITFTGPKKHSVLGLMKNKMYVQKGWIFGQRQYLNLSNPTQESRINEIINKNERDDILIKADQKQLQDLQKEITYSERYVDYINSKYHLPNNNQQKLIKLQQLRSQARENFGLSPVTSPRKQVLQKAQTFQLSPDHRIEIRPQDLPRFSIRAKRCSKLHKTEVDSIITSLRQESSRLIEIKEIEEDNTKTRKKQLDSLLKRIQKQGQMDVSNVNTCCSPVSKVKKSNSSIFATKFSMKSDKSNEHQ